MALKGARSDPAQGVKGAKPRLRLPKLPRRPETETSVKLNEEYLRKRNKILDLKYKREAMELAAARGQLIEKALVEASAGPPPNSHAPGTPCLAWQATTQAG